MSGRFVRASKFRHVHGTPAKKEKAYQNVKAETTGEGNYITASTALWAVALPGGGGPVYAGTHAKVGRIDTTFKVNVHKSKVVDLEFSPFAETLLATASEDGTAKLTMLPVGGLTADITAAVQTLEGHQKKLSLVRWHPTANNVLSTLSYDNTIKVWDVESGKESFNQEFPDFPISMEWNEDGSLLATSCKDKFIRVYDPRAPTAISKVAGLGGAKGQRVVWAGGNRLLSVGFQANNSRGYSLYDCKKMDKEIANADLDSSPGAMIPHYDPDLAMLYLVGKGDAAIKYWELDNSEPYVHFLNEFRESESIKGGCFLPKSMCDTKICEVAICYRVMKDWISPVSFQVPRKSEMFQADIYPDTNAGRPVMTAAEWNGGANKAPLKKSMKPGSAAVTGGVSTDTKFSEGKSAAGASAAAGAGTAQLQAQLDAANARIKELEAEVAALKAAAGK